MRDISLDTSLSAHRKYTHAGPEEPPRTHRRGTSTHSRSHATHKQGSPAPGHRAGLGFRERGRAYPLLPRRAPLGPRPPPRGPGPEALQGRERARHRCLQIALRSVSPRHPSLGARHLGRAGAESGGQDNLPGPRLPARSCAPGPRGPRFSRPQRRGGPSPSPALGPAGRACAGNGARCYATSIPRRRRQHRASGLPGPGCKRAGARRAQLPEPDRSAPRIHVPTYAGRQGMRPAPHPHAASRVCDWFPRSANTQQPQKSRAGMAPYLFVSEPFSPPRFAARCFPRWHPRPPPAPAAPT